MVLENVCERNSQNLLTVKLQFMNNLLLFRKIKERSKTDILIIRCYDVAGRTFPRPEWKFRYYLF